MNAQTTQVSINGERTPLLFGARYRVRYGRDDKILEDALLVDRAKNGDLVFDAGTGTLVMKVRVKPASIDAIFGSGSDQPETDSGVMVPDRFPNETSGSYLRRIEEHFGSRYESFVETPTGQALLEKVAVEDRARRRGARLAVVEEESEVNLDRAAKKRIQALRAQHPDVVAAVEASLAIAAPLAGPQRLEAEILAVVDGPEALCERCGLGAGPHADGSLPFSHCPGFLSGEIDWSPSVRPALAAVEPSTNGHDETTPVRIVRTSPAPKPTKTTKKGRAKLAARGVVDPPTELPAGKVVVVPAKGRPYAERNQVWKCGTCKRRTRQPVCVGTSGAEHPRVEAPAGKRRETR